MITNQDRGRENKSSNSLAWLKTDWWLPEQSTKINNSCYQTLEKLQSTVYY
jgi:hypothetical protein